MVAREGFQPLSDLGHRDLPGSGADRPNHGAHHEDHGDDGYRDADAAQRPAAGNVPREETPSAGERLDDQLQHRSRRKPVQCAERRRARCHVARGRWRARRPANRAPSPVKDRGRTQIARWNHVVEEIVAEANCRSRPPNIRQRKLNPKRAATLNRNAAAILRSVRTSVFVSIISPDDDEWLRGRRDYQSILICTLQAEMAWTSMDGHRYTVTRRNRNRS
jgi:hypothetical protein